MNSRLARFATAGSSPAFAAGAGTGSARSAFHVTLVFSYDHRADLLDELRQQTEAGLVTMRVAATYPPEEAAETHRRMKAGGTRGRCVITF